MPYQLAPQSVTIWQRLEARPKSDLVLPSFAAPVRDPAWFLARQWQVGELSGQDAGSPAYVSVRAVGGKINTIKTGAVTKPYNPGAPIEAQALAEPFSPNDMTLQVEVGQLFGEMIDGRFGAPSEPADRIRGLFLTAFPVAEPQITVFDPVIFFDPVDPATRRFLTMCAGRVINGSAVYLRAKEIANGGSLPPTIDNQPEKPQILILLGELVTWVESVWGGIGTKDPDGWVPARLGYTVSVEATSPTGGSATMSVTPDGEGEASWSAFDVTATATGTNITDVRSLSAIPTHVRFPGMPAARFWDFEGNNVALPDVHPEPRDITKLLALDFMMVHGQDWFIVTVPQDVGLISTIESFLVTDVFGRKTSVSRADASNKTPGLSRWTNFSQTMVPTPTQAASLADFFLTSPTFGMALQGSRMLEQVRMARDEMANMAWAIERNTPSRLGRARSGRERNAAVDEVAPATPPPTLDVTSPLRYLVETPVPIEYIPLVGLKIDPNNPALLLEKAANVRPVPGGNAAVPAASKIMNPQAVQGTPYQIDEEQVSRLGTTVERVVFRTRWIDGSTHLWIQRRRRIGAGETQSGLRFDAANPVAR
jgi:hypothetical protein